MAVEQVLGMEPALEMVECERLRDMPLSRVLYHLLRGELSGGAGLVGSKQVFGPEVARDLRLPMVG